MPWLAAPAPAAAGKEAPPQRAIPTYDIETILGGQWLTWLGILAVFFGTAFFLAYDLGDHPLAGVGQILTGLLVGAAFITGGRTLALRVGRYLARGLLGGGVALLFLSAYASHAFHQLVPAAVVYPFLLGAGLVGAVLALDENSLMVATLTLTGSLLTPFFLTGRHEAQASFFVYLFAVNLGAVLISRRRKWPLLPLAGFLGTAVLVLWWWTRDYTLDTRWIAFGGIGALWLLYAAAPLTAPAEPGFWGVARAFVLAANALLFELALYELLAPELKALRGLATGLLALAYVAAARGVGAARGDANPVRLTRYAGLALAAVAVPVQFDLQWVTLGWALLALALLQAGFAASGLGERLMGYAVLASAVFRALFMDTTAMMTNLAGYRPIFSGNFMVGVATAGFLGLAAWMLSRHRPGLTAAERRLVTPLILTAAVVLWVRLSVETAAGFEVQRELTGADVQRPLLLTLSLIWGVYAGLLVLSGFLFRYRPMRYLGIVVLGVLILKVFVLDIQELERGYRIASFVGVGFLLLLISVLYQRERRSG
jgi:hypothetical protein